MEVERESTVVEVLDESRCWISRARIRSAISKDDGLSDVRIGLNRYLGKKIRKNEKEELTGIVYARLGVVVEI